MRKSRNYKKAILSLLAKQKQPVDVEYVRTGCGIGNWQTALKHLLELQYDGKIEATKTSKSWIFSAKPAERKKTTRSRQAV